MRGGKSHWNACQRLLYDRYLGLDMINGLKPVYIALYVCNDNESNVPAQLWR